MRFIEGIGYIDDNTIIANNMVSKKTAADKAGFDSLLAAETNKLDSSENVCSLDDIFREAAGTYNVSYDLLKAIAYNESGFQSDATSQAGAQGIMQLMPQTAAAMGVEDAYDPYQNIMGGAKLISTLSDMYDGNQTLIIAAYNAGSGNVAKYGGVPPFKETQNYVSKVLNTLNSGVTVSGQNVTQTKSASISDAEASASQTTSIASTADGSSNYINGLTYEEYQLLITYFDTMMDIISQMGETGSDDNQDNDDDSLSDLFRLGTQNNATTLSALSSASYTTESNTNGELMSILAGSITYNKTTIDL